MALAALLKDGDCDLSDGSVEGDWRLPTKEELLGVGTVPPGVWFPTFPILVDIRENENYWTSTSFDSLLAWTVHLWNGTTLPLTKTQNLGVYYWPVRAPVPDADCIFGAMQSCGSNVGQCEEGTQTCDINGYWGDCEGETKPSPEICDGLDNNCDEVADENCNCIDGTQQLCEKQLGVCSGSVKTCVNGVWPICDQSNFPWEYQSTEISCSDNNDNDCDGYTDGSDSDCP
jgi:hypothetical protein